MFQSLRGAFVLATLSGGLLSAQRTWIVDAAGGSGVDFTDLPPAIAAATDGDRVVIRAGTYRPATLTHAIQLAGQPGAFVEMTGASPWNFVVEGIGAGQTCSISGLTFRAQSGASRLRIANCAGVVALADCAVSFPAWSTAVTDCAAVSLLSCTLETGVEIERSAFCAVGSTFTGRIQAFGVPHTITGNQAEIDLTACTVLGLDAQLQFLGTSAMYVQGSNVTLRQRCQLIGGASGYSVNHSLYGANTSQAVYDTSVVFNTPPNSIRLQAASLPALTAQSYRLGTTLQMQLHSPSNDLHALFVALPTPPFSLPWGRQWMDLASESLLIAGIQQTGTTTIALPVPSNLELEGLALAFQSLAGPSLNSLRLSNPLVVVLRR